MTDTYRTNPEAHNHLTACPHHGSNILSKPEFAPAVQKCLELKFEMSEKLREQFTFQNNQLEILNHKFGMALGIKIWTFVETVDTKLSVLTPVESGGETLTEVSFCIVDSRSAKLGSVDVPIDEEEVFQLNCTHIAVSRFADDDVVRSKFFRSLRTFIDTTGAEERASHHGLISSIMTDIRVDLHQFFESGSPASSTIKVWSEHPTLKDFLEQGPSRCLKRRLRSPSPKAQAKFNSQPKPSIEIDSAAPTIIVAPLDKSNSSAPEQENTLKPTASTIRPPQIAHTRRPSLTADAALISPAPVSMVPKFRDADASGRSQRPHTFQPPSVSSDRYVWAHIPANVTSWVHVSSRPKTSAIRG